MIGRTPEETVAWIYARDKEFEDRLKELTITPDVSSLDEFERSVYGALMDCPAMSGDKIASFVARAIWPQIETLHTDIDELRDSGYRGMAGD